MRYRKSLLKTTRNDISFIRMETMTMLNACYLGSLQKRDEEVGGQLA